VLAVSSLAWGSGQHSLDFAFLPWQGETLTKWLFFSGLGGLIVTALAIKRILPVLFLLWTLAVAFLLARGLFFSGYSFGGHSMTFTTGLLLAGGALLSVAGGLLHVRSPRKAIARRHALV
jgi:hypothetical protein